MARQRHPSIPDKGIVTSRLILRPLDRGDARAYGRMIADRRMWTFLTPAYWRRGPRYRIRRWRQLIRSQEAYHFIIRTRDENEFVGEIALHSVNWPNRHAELGYHIVRSQWGKGYATESSERLCRWAFGTAGLRRLEAETAQGNTSSENVLRKLGFRREGHRLERSRIGTRWVSANEYGLLKRQFQRVKANRK